MKRWFILAFLVCALTFSISVDREKRFSTLRTELLSLTHKKVQLVDKIYHEKQILSKVSLDAPTPSIHSRTDEDRNRNARNQAEEIISDYEKQLDALDKQMIRINQDLRLCLGFGTV